MNTLPPSNLSLCMQALSLYWRFVYSSVSYINGIMWVVWDGWFSEGYEGFAVAVSLPLLLLSPTLPSLTSLDPSTSLLSSLAQDRYWVATSPLWPTGHKIRCLLFSAQTGPQRAPTVACPCALLLLGAGLRLAYSPLGRRSACFRCSFPHTEVHTNTQRPNPICFDSTIKTPICRQNIATCRRNMKGQVLSGSCIQRSLWV